MTAQSDFFAEKGEDARMKIRVVAIIALLVSSLSPATAAEPFIVGGARPVNVWLPDQIPNPAPLLVLLHSASTSGAHQEHYMKLAPVAKENGIIYIAPDGTVSPEGKRFWNAAKSCCNKFGIQVDDVAYINSLIDEISAKYPIDPKRIYFIGHSNGAFMSYTFACKTNRVAAIVAIAGAMDAEPECKPSQPVSLLDIHGTADKTIQFHGGKMNFHPYTSAPATVNTYAEVNKCTKPISFRKDFEPTIKGLETTIFNYSCATHTHLQFWEIKKGSHSPKLPADFAQLVIKFLLRQSKAE